MCPVGDTLTDCIRESGSEPCRYFRVTHAPVPSMSPDWVAATHEMADGHMHRQASPVDVELNPARRLREHANKSKGKLVDMGGWF